MVIQDFLSAARPSGTNSYYLTLANLTDIGECDFQLQYNGPYYWLLGWSNGGQWAPAGTVLQSASITLDDVVDLSPGQTTTVQFDMPQQVDAVGHPPSQPNGYAAASEIDFSWYYLPWAKGQSYDWFTVQYIAQTLLKYGAVDVSSPAGCEVMPNEPEKLWLDFSYLTGASGPAAGQSGVPFFVNCTSLNTGTLEEVTIPFAVPSSGSYMVVPVFSVEGVESSTSAANYLYVKAAATVSGWGYVVYTSWLGVSGSRGAGWFGSSPYYFYQQYAAPMVIDSPRPGTGSVTIYLTYNNSAGSSSYVKAAAITVSKVVLIPIVSAPTYCTFTVDSNFPVLPWATLDMETGAVSRDAPIILNYAFNSSASTPANNPYLYIYAGANESGTVSVFQNLALYVSNSTVEFYNSSNGATMYLGWGNSTMPSYVAPDAYFEAWVTPNLSVPNPNFATHVYAGLWPWNGPYSPSSWSPFGVLNPYAGSYAWLYLYQYSGSRSLYPPPQSQLNIQVHIPYSNYTDYFIYLFVYGASYEGITSGIIRVPPSVSVSGGYLVYPTNMKKYIDEVSFADVWVVSPSSQTVTISISPPMGVSSVGWSGFIGVEAVVVAPAYYSFGYNAALYTNPNAPLPNSAVQSGLTLQDVTPAPGVNYFDVEIVDLDTGTTLASWTVPVSALNGGSTITLGWDGYYPPNLWPYLVQAQPEEIVIDGLQCPAPTPPAQP